MCVKAIFLGVFWVSEKFCVNGFLCLPGKKADSSYRGVIHY